jgi:hypothetical protein
MDVAFAKATELNAHEQISWVRTIMIESLESWGINVV